MKARRGGVLEEEGDGISGDGPAASALGREGRRGGVVHPHARVSAGRGIASEEHHGFVGGSAIRRALARHLVHLNVLAAKQPLEVHIMDGLLAGDGAAQYPMPHQAWKERVRMQLLGRTTLPASRIVRERTSMICACSHLLRSANPVAHLTPYSPAHESTPDTANAAVLAAISDIAQRS